MLANRKQTEIGRTKKTRKSAINHKRHFLNTKNLEVQDIRCKTYIVYLYLKKNQNKAILLSSISSSSYRERTKKCIEGLRSTKKNATYKQYALHTTRFHF